MRVNNNDHLWVFGIFIFIAILVVPFLAIWSLNTLFALAIPYTWETWLSVVVLSTILKPAISIKGK